MRKSTPDAAITSSASGTISRSGKGAGSDAKSSQSFALRHVEDGEPLEEGHRPGLAAFALGPLFLGLGGKAVGIDHRLPALAPADASACLPCLPEREPRLRRKAVLDHRAPQDQAIHARIGPCGERIARQSRSGTATPAPCLHHWKAPRLPPGTNHARHPRPPRRTHPPAPRASRNVSHDCDAKPCSITAPHRIRTFTPE